MAPPATDLRRQVERTHTITTVPHIVVKLGALIDCPSPCTTDIADEIAKDQVLTAKVLKLVNSGFCGLRTPITTIRHALVILGLDVVRTLVVSTTVVDIFAELAGALEGLWEHSLGTARISHAISVRLDMDRPEEIAVAGLLHDIGKLIIAECFPEHHASIRAMVADRDCLQIDAEREVLGVTHQDVGMWLLKKWALPSKLVYPVAYHNSFHPQRDHADATAVVHVADILCRAQGFGHPGDGLVPAMDPEAWKQLDLTMGELGAIGRQVEIELAGELG